MYMWIGNLIVFERKEYLLQNIMVLFVNAIGSNKVHLAVAQFFLHTQVEIFLKMTNLSVQSNYASTTYLLNLLSALL